MAEPNKPQPGGVDKQGMKQILVPALAVAGIVLLVGLVVSMSGGGAPKMPHDGSNGGTDDPDLKELAPGVKYRDLKVGVGDECPPGVEVTIHYVGWLPDGTVFDSSRDKGQPVTFQLPRLIPGWQEGVPGMKPGGIRKLVISADKGYGNKPSGKIPANSTLVFEIELKEFKAPPKALTGGPGQPMPHDQSNGGTDDPGLKDIGGGLKVRDLKEGSGDPVAEGATVTIHYVGWLPDGTVFDSSRDRGQPANFPLGGLIQGWQKGIPGMKPGGVRKLVVPPDLGYGAIGSPPKIPGNSTLIFEVELVK